MRPLRQGLSGVMGGPDPPPARLRTALFLRSVTDSLFNGPVIDVNILEDPWLVGKNDPADAGVYDYPFAEQAGNRCETNSPVSTSIPTRYRSAPTMSRREAWITAFISA